MTIELYYKKMTESLKLLSLSFDEQEKCFPDFVDIPFEILDTFYNAFLLLPQQIEKKLYSYQVIAELLRLYNLVAMASGSLSCNDYSKDHFISSDEWSKIRDLSKLILSLMEEPIEKPNLQYI